MENNNDTTSTSIVIKYDGEKEDASDKIRVENVTKTTMMVDDDDDGIKKVGMKETNNNKKHW